MFLDIFEQTSYISRVHILQNLKGVITRNLRHITICHNTKAKSYIKTLSEVNGLSQSLHCTQMFIKFSKTLQMAYLTLSLTLELFFSSASISTRYLSFCKRLHQLVTGCTCCTSFVKKRKNI